MSILPSAQQKAVLDSKSDVTFVSCSAGAGATTTALLMGLASEAPALIVGMSARTMSYTAEWFCKETGAEYWHGINCISVQQGGKSVELVSYENYKQNKNFYRPAHIIFDYASSFPKDMFNNVDCSRLTIFSVPTEDKNHPTYKLAKNMSRPYIFFQDGFPFFADKVESLDDVFGDGYSFETHRMSYLENTWLTKSSPQYAENINCMSSLERKRLKGYWSFEDVLNY